MAEEPRPSTDPSRTLPDTSNSNNDDPSTSQPSDTSTTNKNNNTDTAALDAAVSNLRVSAPQEQGGNSAGSGAGGGGGVKADVKVEAGDVAFLTTNLEISKSRATELLKAANGDRGKAVRGFVIPVAVSGGVGRGGA